MCSIRPPGRRQRRSSRYTGRAVAKVLEASLDEKMKSNEASTNGRCAASQTRRSTPVGRVADASQRGGACKNPSSRNEAQCTGRTSEATKPSPPPISRPAPRTPSGTGIENGAVFTQTLAAARRRPRLADTQVCSVRPCDAKRLCQQGKWTHSFEWNASCSPTSLSSRLDVNPSLPAGPSAQGSAAGPSQGVFFLNVDRGSSRRTCRTHSAAALVPARDGFFRFCDLVCWLFFQLRRMTLKRRSGQ